MVRWFIKELNVAVMDLTIIQQATTQRWFDHSSREFSLALVPRKIRCSDCKNTTTRLRLYCKVATMNWKLVIFVAIATTTAEKEPVCQQNGFFGYPNDCTRFYRCVDLTGSGNFQKYSFSCPVGTAFDQELSICNFLHSVVPCGSVAPKMKTVS